ncbi:hypothetical protein BCV71DRAFT_239271 [Rhizopus microsporus]|uniref:Uncharacterized protein n=1 Tax=Rhizopus microsporus TaxID=58291 RepID=A0A1X0RNA2_RHIZD|nr:hypothetical protein BCV71DRAFT_239271 [Rhizopus microsporus]
MKRLSLNALKRWFYLQEGWYVSLYVRTRGYMVQYLTQEHAVAGFEIEHVRATTTPIPVLNLLCYVDENIIDTTTEALFLIMKTYQQRIVTKSLLWQRKGEKHRYDDRPVINSPDFSDIPFVMICVERTSTVRLMETVVFLMFLRDHYNTHASCTLWKWYTQQ